MISEAAKQRDLVTKEAMNKVDIQIATELYYNKKTVRSRVKKEMLLDSELMECLGSAVTAITEWATTFKGYKQKELRLSLLVDNNDIEELITIGMCIVMMLDDRSDLITSLAGQLAYCIEGMDDHRDCVITAGEILTLMCDADLFDMELTSRNMVDEATGEEYQTKSWYISNPWELTHELSLHIKRAMYLPPMIVQPKVLTHNRSTGYLTKEDESLILGKGNHHDGDICLDSLNRFNAIPLSLNVPMLTTITKDLLVDDKLYEKFTSDPKRKEQYEAFMEKSYHIFAYLVKNGNKFHLENKPDKRGRTYSQGYHCNVQGDKFRKSAIELHHQEVVNGQF